jgi:ADP-ribose pyrophosphatase YjhB (NUDIX family)
VILEIRELPFPRTDDWMLRLLVTAVDRVLLQRICSDKMRRTKGKWDTPANYGLPGENLETAAVRILGEDVGRVTIDFDLWYLFHMHMAQDGKPVTVIFLECRALNSDQVPLQSSSPDVDATDWFKLDGLPPIGNTLTYQAIHFALASRTFR